jgi:predicted phosphoribosyltransferase
VPVGYEVARRLGVPLDLLLVRKLGVPGHEELAMGAIASGGRRVLNYDVVEALQIGEDVLETVAAREQSELDRRELAYRGGRPPPDLAGKTAILVDDGLATGSTMRAAARAVRAQRPSRTVIAVPVAAAQTCAELRSESDEVVCVASPEPFYAVGFWYEDFSQTTDEEVRALLARSRECSSEPPELPGSLGLPESPVDVPAPDSAVSARRSAAAPAAPALNPHGPPGRRNPAEAASPAA